MDESYREVSYHKLIVFQKAKQLVLLIYKLTKNYPKDELFALVSQIRRAVISIVANIVEGYSKSSTKEYARFLDIAIGSAGELKIFLEISLELGYLNQEDYKNADDLLTEVRKLLYTYKKSLENKFE